MTASPAGRAAAAQTTATTTLSFPSDFEEPVLHNDSPFTAEYDFDYHLPHASITQTVIDRGGIIPWASIDGGNSWHAGGFDITAATARANLRRYLKTNPLLIRFFIITDQE